MSSEGDIGIWTGLCSIGGFMLLCLGITTKSQNTKINNLESTCLTKDKHNDLCIIKSMKIKELILESEDRIIKKIEGLN